MDIFMAIVLGIVQGITEPLPISSSGHLILVPWILHWPEHTLTFDVALHGGTALAIIAYFWKDWCSLAGALLGGLYDRNFSKDQNRKLVLLICVSSIPAGIAGLLFENKIEEMLREPNTVVFLLVLAGVAMMLADRYSTHRRAISQVTIWDAITIGFAQALALAPGVSRSGITITAALLLQMNRSDAARFSFLLSGPVVTGAFVYKMFGLIKTGIPASDVAPFIAGIFASTIVGYASISFLLGYLQKRSLDLFAYYRFALGALVLAMFLLRGLA